MLLFIVAPATLYLLLLSAQLFSVLCSRQEVDWKHGSILKLIQAMGLRNKNCTNVAVV